MIPNLMITQDFGHTGQYDLSGFLPVGSEAEEEHDHLEVTEVAVEVPHPGGRAQEA